MSAMQFNPEITDAVKVTQAAQEQLSALVDAEDDISGVRVFVAGGGCGGMTYGMTFVEQPNEFDCVKEQDGLKVYVDAVALGFLEGVEIDYRQDGVNRSFVFKNVFANTGGSGTCGACGAAGGGCA